MIHKRIIILISGSGSNLQAFIDAQNNEKLNGKIVAVLSNKPDAYGLTRAKAAGIDTISIDHSEYKTREDFDQAMITQLNKYQPDLIILAGFMRILTGDFIKSFEGKVLNIHPSLLPKYPGLNTHKRAVENKDQEHGTSVHFVTEKLDGGPLIAQSKIILKHGDSIEEITKQVQKLEHQLYPQVASWFLTDRLKYERDGVYFDNNKLLKPITSLEA